MSIVELPPLAGLCTYTQAARSDAYDVDEDITRLVRYVWLEQQIMRTGVAWLNPTPEWEGKEALSLHVYLAAEHVQGLRERVTEMRSPAPRMDVCPDPALGAFVNEMLTATSTTEKLVGLYGVLYPALMEAYRQHIEHAHPIADYPTRRLLRHLVLDLEEVMAWGESALAAIRNDPVMAEIAEVWSGHLHAYLTAAGGIMGHDPRSVDALPPPRARQPFVPDFSPQRDERFINAGNFQFPPHEVARTDGIPVAEKTLALMCKRALEMDVPEAMARMIWEAPASDWKYFVQMCRQLWDEARHAMLGEIYLEAQGIRWHLLPLHPGFSLRLNQHMSALEAHAVLYMIEQSLMPATTGKRYEWEIARETHDPLAQLIQDFDWADEVLHVHIGRQWLLPMMKMSREEVIALGQRCATESEAALTAYQTAPQVNWWPDFVRATLHQESAMTTYGLGTADPVYRNTNA